MDLLGNTAEQTVDRSKAILTPWSRFSWKGQDPFLSSPVDAGEVLGTAKIDPPAKCLPLPAPLKPFSRWSWKDPNCTTPTRKSPSTNKHVTSECLTDFETSSHQSKLPMASISITETWLHQNTKTAGYNEDHQDPDHKDVFFDIVDKEGPPSYETEEIKMAAADFNTNSSEASSSAPSTPLRSTRFDSLDTPFTPATEYSDDGSGLFSLSERNCVVVDEDIQLGQLSRQNQQHITDVAIEPNPTNRPTIGDEETFEGIGYQFPLCSTCVGRDKRKTMLRKLAYARKDELSEVLQCSGAGKINSWMEIEMPLGRWDFFPEIKVTRAT